MGRLMRLHWFPFMVSGELEPGGPPKRVWLLGERLVAFRGTDGRVGLLDEFCPHRLVSLYFGRNEGTGLRCAYHGWKFDRDGRCLETPSEPSASQFARKVRAKGVGAQIGSVRHGDRSLEWDDGPAASTWDDDLPMPHKHNEPRRHKIPKARYRVENWREYEVALRDRGSLTVWVTPEAIAAWHPARTGRPGRSAHYSDLAIETGVMLRLAFARPWRQTEGLLRSVTTLLGLSLDVPDHTTLSRRSAALSLVTALAVPAGPVTVVIDSTGLKVFGAGEWRMAKHGGRDRRTWRKLHLAIDPDTGEVLASALTTTEEGDASLVGPLLDQIAAPIAAVMADGAYDGDPVYRAVADRAPAATVIIPPRATAVASQAAAAGTPTQRDRHIEMIAAKGRLGWQKAVGYGRRSLVETGMLRYRTLSAQKVEARVGCKVLNRMTALGMPVSRRLA